LPALAGLADFVDAIEPGMSVEESVRRLKVAHYAFRRLHGIWVSRIASEPVYELKMAFSHHAYLAAEHVTALRMRVGEMREPPLGLEKVPAPGLELLFDEIRQAPTTAGLLMGIYEVALPGLMAALQRHRDATHPLADQPTRRLLRWALLEVEELLDYGRRAIQSLVRAEDREAFAPGRRVLEGALAASGGLDGCEEKRGDLPGRLHSGEPWRYDGVPRRDGRFADPYNMGVNAEVFLYDPAMPAEGKVLMMYYKRLREIDVPEMMSSIVSETDNKPWGYYRDMTRQLWDEARHAMMGEVGFVSAGVDWAKAVRVNFTWSLGLNTQLTPKERHAVLYFIEQGLMPSSAPIARLKSGMPSRSALDMPAGSGASSPSCPSTSATSAGPLVSASTNPNITLPSIAKVGTTGACRPAALAISIRSSSAPPSTPTSRYTTVSAGRSGANPARKRFASAQYGQRQPVRRSSSMWSRASALLQ
jgi:hypothetical protein